MLVRRASADGFLAHSGREVLSRCVALQRYGGSLTFRGELEPGAPSPLGEVVVVRDVALVQASQGFLRRQLPRLDRLARKSRVSDDYQTVIKQRLDRGDHSRLARREWLSPIVVLNDGVDIAERQAFSARHVTK